MPRHLFLLRHAKTSKDPAVARDVDRPLTDEGREDARRVGRWLRRQGIRPQRVVSSPALRARQTTQIVLGELGLGDDRVEWEDPVYEADTTTLLHVLAARSGADSLLLVGHNPSLEALIEVLCGPMSPAPDGRTLPPGSLARLTLPEEGDAAGRTRLAGILRPDELPA